MEAKQKQPETLAYRLGGVSPFSPLLRKVQQLSGCPADKISLWLLKCAVERGAAHYRRHFEPELPADNPTLTNEELGIALCLTQHPFDPMLVRAAAQLLSAPDTDPAVLARLAEMERCVPVMLHIAEAAQRIAPQAEPWCTLHGVLPRRHHVHQDSLPHWSRFVLQTGYTPAGRGTHIEWLKRHE